jgi:membrane associated rhomboid family serine protease
MMPMGPIRDEQAGLPAPEFCYRHPRIQTGVHCTRCGRPICPECMIPAPIGHQCPQCVGDARREFGRGAGRQLRAGAASATKVLLVALFAVFVVELIIGGPGSLLFGPSDQRLFDLGALYPPAIATGQYWRLLSAMFLHANLLHIGVNAYALWLFGNVVEQEFGRARFLVIFFVTGLLASVASYAFGPALELGVGVFGAFIAYNYRRRHLAMAAANLRMAVLLIVVNAALAFAWHGIDWRAHVGGLVSGIAAGHVAEGFGTARQRTIVRILGFGALIALGVALVIWRTDHIRSMLGL